MTKPELIEMLRKVAYDSGGDKEASHHEAEKAILSFIGDPDITHAWEYAAQYWWYA